jgi:NRPS condensation-like uncharacterized protein
MLHLDALSTNNGFLGLSACVLMAAHVDRAQLRRAFELVVRRHEVLRTSFQAVDGSGSYAQIVMPADEAVLSMRVEDSSTMGRDAALSSAMSMVDEEANSAFDLEAGPLVRVLLVHVSDDEHVLLVNTHHAISDGWSLDLIWSEVYTAYTAYVEGREPDMPALSVQYSDYARWQREWLDADGGAERLRQLAYWREQLAGAPLVLDLPTDYPRPAMQSHEGSCLHFELDESLCGRLHQLASDHQCSLYIVLLTAYGLFLSRYTGSDDIVVGSPFAGRGVAATANSIGCFFNTIAVRLQIHKSMSISELFAKVKSITLDAFDNSDVHWSDVLHQTQRSFDASRTSSLTTEFALNENEARANDTHQTWTELAQEYYTTVYDLELAFTPRRSVLCGELR